MWQIIICLVTFRLLEISYEGYQSLNIRRQNIDMKQMK